MKYLIRLLAVISLAALLSLTTACDRQSAPQENVTTTTEQTSSPTAAQPSQKPIGAPAAEPATESSPTEAPTDPPTEAPEDNDAVDQAILTSGKWILSEVYLNGEKYQGNYYGSIITQTGAYLEFNTDNSFNCVLGYAGCKGSYSVENGEVTAYITTVYDGRSAEGNAVDETQTLIWDKGSGTIQLVLNDVTNYFRQN